MKSANVTVEKLKVVKTESAVEEQTIVEKITGAVVNAVSAVIGKKAESVPGVPGTEKAAEEPEVKEEVAAEDETEECVCEACGSSYRKAKSAEEPEVKEEVKAEAPEEPEKEETKAEDGVNIDIGSHNDDEEEEEEEKVETKVEAPVEPEKKEEAPDLSVAAWRQAFGYQAPSKQAKNADWMKACEDNFNGSAYKQ